jgi:glycosyltransferase involved in cell wall biosynthesis
LADAMLQLLADKNEARQMGAVGAARAKRLFSWEAVTKQLTSLYQSLTSEEPITRLYTN